MWIVCAGMVLIILLFWVVVCTNLMLKFFKFKGVADSEESQPILAVSDTTGLESSFNLQGLH